MNKNFYNYAFLAKVREGKHTQEKFAELLNVTVTTLSRMENGHNASYELIFKTCQLLDIDSNEIFYSTRPAVLATPDVDPHAQAIARIGKAFESAGDMKIAEVGSVKAELFDLPNQTTTYRVEFAAFVKISRPRTSQ